MSTYVYTGVFKNYFRVYVIFQEGKSFLLKSLFGSWRRDPTLQSLSSRKPCALGSQGADSTWSGSAAPGALCAGRALPLQLQVLQNHPRTCQNADYQALVPELLTQEVLGEIWDLAFSASSQVILCGCLRDQTRNTESMSVCRSSFPWLGLYPVPRFRLPGLTSRAAAGGWGTKSSEWK